MRREKFVNFKISPIFFLESRKCQFRAAGKQKCSILKTSRAPEKIAPEPFCGVKNSAFPQRRDASAMVARELWKSKTTVQQRRKRHAALARKKRAKSETGFFGWGAGKPAPKALGSSYILLVVFSPAVELPTKSVSCVSECLQSCKWCFRVTQNTDTRALSAFLHLQFRKRRVWRGAGEFH